MVVKKSEGESSRVTRHAGWLLGLLVLSAVFVVVLQNGDIERFAELVYSISFPWLCLALLLQIATYICAAMAWQRGLQGAGVRQPVRGFVSLAVSKLFIEHTVPTGGISGTVFFVVSLVRRGIPESVSLAVLLASLVSNYGANVLAALVGLALLTRSGEVQPWMVSVFLLFTLFCLFIPAVVLLLRYCGCRSRSWISRVPRLAPLLQTIINVPTSLLRQPWLLLLMVSLNVAVIILDASTLWVILHALALEENYKTAFLSYLLALMVMTLGPIPMGLGTFEAACTSMLVHYGTPVEEALAATLLLRGYTTWLPLLPGLFLVSKELRSPNGRGASSHIP